jgi:hypothetical protein
MAKKVMATHANKTPHLADGRIQDRIELRRVEVLAEAKGYAMVRRPGCMPYVAPIKEIKKETP